MLIGELARRGGVPPRTIRYYERLGVLSPALRTVAGYRDYAADAVDGLAFVRACKSIGFTLHEIAELVAAKEGQESPCAQLIDLVERRAEEVERRILDLSRARLELLSLAARARSLAPSDCPPTAVEELIVGRDDAPPLPRASRTWLERGVDHG